MARLSICMITYNNERIVEEALESARFADEICVLDSHSTDATVEIAKRYADRFEQQPFAGFQQQYNDCVAMATGDWVMFLDADEVIDDELRGAIEALVARDGDPGVGAYRVNRRVRYMGRWIRHGPWAKDSELRVARRGDAHFTPGLHSTLGGGSGGEQTLPGLILHHSFPEGDSLTHQQEKANLYSTIAAKEAFEQGKRPSIRRMAGNSLFRFIRGYFLQLGFLDGVPGFMIASSTAWYVCLREAKLWEMWRGR